MGSASPDIEVITPTIFCEWGDSPGLPITITITITIIILLLLQ